jgi:hypothetical protein
VQSVPGCFGTVESLFTCALSLICPLNAPVTRESSSADPSVTILRGSKQAQASAISPHCAGKNTVMTHVSGLRGMGHATPPGGTRRRLQDQQRCRSESSIDTRHNGAHRALAPVVRD